MFGRRNNLSSFLVGGALGFVSAVMLANRNGKKHISKPDDTVNTVDNMINKDVLDDVKSVMTEQSIGNEPTDQDTRYS
jgi:gas vesicle protein